MTLTNLVTEKNLSREIVFSVAIIDLEIDCGQITTQVQPRKQSNQLTGNI